MRKSFDVYLIEDWNGHYMISDFWFSPDPQDARLFRKEAHAKASLQQAKKKGLDVDVMKIVKAVAVFQ